MWTVCGIPIHTVFEHTSSNMSTVARRLKPLLDRVLVQRAVKPSKTAGGILLPESSLGKMNEGIVVAVGPGRKLEDGSMNTPSVSVGDNVLLPEYGGNTVKLDEEEFIIYRNEDLLGVFDESK